MNPTPSLIRGDCVEYMASCAPHTFDAIVTDPPYHMESVVKRFGKPGSAPAKAAGYNRMSRRFIGVQWDAGDVAFDPATWGAALDCLKPGGHLVAFALPQTYDRLATAVRAAGFEIRDCLVWLFRSGNPKTHPQPDGWQTHLKPGCELIVLARKPLIGTVANNRAQFGVGALNVPAIREPDGLYPSTVLHDGDAGLDPADRTFMCAKASKDDRAGSNHPTVKPVALMRWLVGLICPPGGHVLDPFAGSGTTLQAAQSLGMHATGCEAEPEYQADIVRRLSLNPTLEDMLA